MLATKSTSAPARPGRQLRAPFRVTARLRRLGAVTQRSKSWTACHRKVGRCAHHHPVEVDPGGARIAPVAAIGVRADDAVDMHGREPARPRARSTRQIHRARRAGRRAWSRRRDGACRRRRPPRSPGSGASAGGGGPAPVAEQRDDRSKHRPPRLQRAHQEDLLRFEQDVRDVVRAGGRCRGGRADPGRPRRPRAPPRSRRARESDGRNGAGTPRSGR